MRVDLFCPVENQGVTISTNSQTGEPYALFQLYNLSDRSISSLSFTAGVFDENGALLGEIPVSLEELSAEPKCRFAEDKAVSLVKTLYEHYMRHTDELPKFFLELGLKGEPREKVVCDYISSMTDRFAISLYDELYVPKFWMGQ